MRAIIPVGVVMAMLAVPAPATAAERVETPTVTVAAGVTQPVFGYADAIRERVWVDTDFDSDRDGVKDVVRVDLIRPAATERGLKAPVIIDNSPYYTTLGRGNESELKADIDNDGLLDRWPLFYDNYFVPRGYAVALVDMVGTAGSTGCPTIQGANENATGPAVVDWLNGRRTAHDSHGDPVVVDWHNGKSGMIGKSYDGSLAMAAAVSGVKGLSTVVPISGPYNYYDYTRGNGIVTRGNNYLGSLARTITDDDPARQSRCAPVWNEIAANDGDEHGDYTPFWDERNYLDDAAKIKASVFLVHGIQDDNVRADHVSKFWQALKTYDVPRKLWLGRVGHIDPFDFRRDVWVDTLHRWFDYWLQGVDNGIMDEPKVDVEPSSGVWEQHADWPIPGTGNVDVWLRPGADSAGTLALTPAKAAPTTRSFLDNPSQTEAAMISNPSQPNGNRLAFLSPPLTEDLRISGTPVVDLVASSSLAEAYFGAILVEYGPSTQNDRSGDGVLQTTLPEECYGESSPSDDGCYRPVAYRPTSVTQWRVTKGIRDGQNRDSVATPEPMTPNQMYEISVPLLPEDYVFSAGNRIGVIIVGSYRSYSAQTLASRPTITVNTKVSHLSLPVLGGHQAARQAGIPLR
ncbi:CocE/NonD family hydrolase [Micromonospora sp. URMC 103]|uniref:CocE/NonD family hydrolase n=1 Tax=Micromonospora sp. URMC 103 TaxID=3423406 RepID=UPI003F19C20F